MKSLYEDDHVLVLFQEASSTNLTIFSFCDLGFVTSGKNRSGSFWGAPFFQKLGIPAIGLIPKTDPNWFPEASMRKAAQHVKNLSAHYPQRIGYGHSMGGYAALKYGALLEATIALSFCPQYSIDPDIVSDFDNRFQRYFRKDLNAAMEVTDADLPNKSYIFFDPLFPTDRKHVELIERAAQSRPVHLIDAPMTAHATIAAVTGGDTIEAIIREAILNNPLAIQDVVRSARRNSPLRAYSAAFVCAANGKLNLSGRIYENAKGLISQPQRIELLQMMAVGHKRRGELSLAVGWFKEWIKISPSNIQSHFALADCLIAIGDFEQASVAIARAKALMPNTELALLMLASLNERVGFISEAAEVYSRIAKLYGKSHSALLASALFHQRNKMLDQAIAAFQSALKMQPRHELSLSRLLTLQMQTKDFVAAAKTSQDLGESFPANEAYRTSLLRLKSIPSPKPL